MDISCQRVNLTEPIQRNHKIRFISLSFSTIESGQAKQCFTLRFSSKDNSLYLCPSLISDMSFETESRSEKTTGKFSHKSSAGDHVSFHESGVVNFSVGKDKLRIREAGELDSKSPLFTVGIKRLNVFKPIDFVLPGRIGGSGGEPVLIKDPNLNAPAFFSVFRYAKNEECPQPPIIVTDGNPIEWTFVLKNCGTKFLVSLWSSNRPMQKDFLITRGFPAFPIPDIRIKPL